MVNRSQGNIDAVRIGKEFENEGVELSNKKINTMVASLKTYLHKSLKEVAKSQDLGALVATISNQLGERSGLKPNII